MHSGLCTHICVICLGVEAKFYELSRNCDGYRGNSNVFNKLSDEAKI